MDNLLYEIKDGLACLTFNRIDKSNAFDEELLKTLQLKLDEAQANPDVKIIMINANGKHFSAGADAAWMQRMVAFNEQENTDDALILAQVMSTIYHATKPTIAVVQGSAYGGGAGLVAACDIAIAADNASFCFSEVKLGLIPAVISPYIINAIGTRLTKWLFMTAEPFSAQQALDFHLIHYCVPKESLEPISLEIAKKIQRLAPLAVNQCKALIEQIAYRPIDSLLSYETASLIAKKRISKEAQIGLNAFLNKELPEWTQ